MRFAWVALAVSIGFATPATAADPVPIEAFAKLPSIERPAISPSGHAIVALAATEGESRLAVIPLNGSRRVALEGTGIDINWVQWVNQDWLAVGIGEATSFYGYPIYARRIMRISADLKTRDVVAASQSGIRADDVIWMADDGSPRLLLAREPRLGTGFWPDVIEVDMATGKWTQAAKSVSGVVKWSADATGTVRAGIGVVNGGRDLRIVYRDGADQKWETVDRVSRRAADQLIIPEVFLDQPGKALVVANDDEGFSGIFPMNLRTGEREAPVFVRKGYDVDGILFAPGSRMPVGFEVTEDRVVQHWTDPELKSVQAALDKAVGPGRTATITSISKGRERMIVLVGGPSEPGRWYVLDRVDEKMIPFAWVNDAIRRPLHPVRSIRYKARDGLEIHAILTLPKEKPASALPLIVMPHGGPHMRDSESWDWWAQFLADRGYAVVQPNYRGSTGFGEAFLKAGEGQWGLGMQDDLVDVVRHLAAEKLIDPARVCIVGGSYGGYAALRAAQRDTGIYRCAVSFAGVSDLTKMLRYDRGYLGREEANDYWKGQTPDLSAVSPLQAVEQFSIPVLLVHGKLDGRVPVSQSKLLAERLAQARKPHRYVEQPKGDHNLSREEDRIQLLKEMEAFLQQHNPA